MGAPLKLVALVALVALATGGPSLAEDNFCQGCRSLVSFASKFNSTDHDQRADYRELFKNFCELYYPPSTDYQQGPCPLFVEGLLYMIDRVDPIHHCDQIGACGPSHATQPSDDIYEYLSGSNNNIIKPMSASKDSGVCQMCEQTINFVKEQLSDPNYIDELKKAAGSFCDYLEVIGQAKECRQIVDSYADQLIDFVRKIDAEQYCQLVGLCQPARKAVQSPQQLARNQVAAALPSLADFQNFGIETSVMIGEKPRLQQDDDSTMSPQNHRKGPECMLCKAVIEGLFKFLREKRTEADIEKALDQICSLLYRRGEKRDQCDSMVKAYTREIVQLMIDETNPEVICMLIDMCAYEKSQPSVEFKMVGESTSSARSALVPRDHEFTFNDLFAAMDGEEPDKSREKCLECRLFIKFIRQRLGSQVAEMELIKWVEENLCHRMPKQQLVSDCTKLINKNAHTLLQAVKGVLQPRAACRDLGVCMAPTIVSMFTFESNLNGQAPGLRLMPASIVAGQSGLTASQKVLNRPAELSGQMCDQCVQIVTQIDEYLSSHPIDQDVAVIIDKVCNQLPEGQARGECTYIIKMFGAEIVQAITTMDNPKQLCSKIYLC